jgi:hypothetical protein
LQDLEPDLEGFNFGAETEKSLMDFSFKVHLDTLFCVVDGLNCATDFANLGENELPFVV